MNILAESILLALVTALAPFDWWTGTNNISRPIVTSVFVGLILGNMRAGIVIGGTLELAFVGAITIGAAKPPDIISGGILGVAFAISTGKGPGFALTLAFPIAALFLIVDNLLTMLVIPMFSKKADAYAVKGDLNHVALMHQAAFLSVKVLPRALFVGFAFYYGNPIMKSILNAIPGFVQNGINIAAGIMPALGFAILLRMLLKKDVFVYLIIGFVLYSYLNIPIMGIAIIGACIAVVLAIYDNKIRVASCKNAIGEENNEDDF